MGRARTREDPMSAGGRRDEEAGAALGAGKADAPAHGATSGTGASMAKSGDGHSQGRRFGTVRRASARAALLLPLLGVGTYANSGSTSQRRYVRLRTLKYLITRNLMLGPGCLGACAMCLNSAPYQDVPKCIEHCHSPCRLGTRKTVSPHDSLPPAAPFSHTNPL